MSNIAKTNLPPVIALTGGIGCGKSEVLKAFADLGATVISADQIAKEVVAKGTVGLDKIIAKFGSNVLLSSGELDRKKLAEIVFNSDQDRKDLEAITHPLIRTRSSEIISEALNSDKTKLIVYEIPLYFESGLKYPEIDSVLVVSAPEDITLRRLIDRGMTENDVKKRIAAQLPLSFKLQHADYIIDNSSDLVALISQVKIIYDSLVNKST